VLLFNWAPRREGVLGEWRYSSTHSLTSGLDGGKWSASHPGRFIPRERALGTHWIGGWVGPRAVLDAVVKRKIPSPLRESNPRTPIVQLVAQCCTGIFIISINFYVPEPNELNFKCRSLWVFILYPLEQPSISPVSYLPSVLPALLSLGNRVRCNAWCFQHPMLFRH
jgi:hypothetical protein